MSTDDIVLNVSGVSKRFGGWVVDTLILSKLIFPDIKKQIAEFNKILRFGDEKSGPRPGFPGIENKDEALLHFQRRCVYYNHLGGLICSVGIGFSVPFSCKILV